MPIPAARLVTLIGCLVLIVGSTPLVRSDNPPANVQPGGSGGSANDCYLVPDAIVEAPNIIVIVADDMGWGQPSVNGGAADTPNIADLVSNGLHLQQFYVSPVCSPTRQMLLTGRYPIRWGQQHRVIRPWENVLGIPTGVTLLSEILKTANYATGIVGKWHLGQTNESFPTSRGFDEFQGNISGGVGYCTLSRDDCQNCAACNGCSPTDSNLDWWCGKQLMDSNEGFHHTDLVKRKAVDFIQRHANEPFFLYVAMYAPHKPNEAPEELVCKYLEKLDCNDAACDTRARQYAQIEYMDSAVGEILAELDNSSARPDDTIVWFLSDNGHVFDLTAGGDNDLQALDLRGGKATVYDGGIRSLSAIRYPNGLANCYYSGLVGVVDVVPTLLDFVNEATDVEPPLSSPGPLDGRSLISTLRDQATMPDWEYFAAIEKTAGICTDKAAVIASRGNQLWKLVRDHSGFQGPNCKTNWELFNLNVDPVESSNLLSNSPSPEILALEAELTSKLVAWESSCGVGQNELCERLLADNKNENCLCNHWPSEDTGSMASYCTILANNPAGEQCEFDSCPPAPAQAR